MRRIATAADLTAFDIDLSDDPDVAEMQLLTPKQFSKIMRWSLAYVYLLASQKKIPTAVYAGRSVRFHRAKTMAWLNGATGFQPVFLDKLYDRARRELVSASRSRMMLAWGKKSKKLKRVA